MASHDPAGAVVEPARVHARPVRGDPGLDVDEQVGDARHPQPRRLGQGQQAQEQLGLVAGAEAVEVAAGPPGELGANGERPGQGRGHRVAERCAQGGRRPGEQVVAVGVDVLRPAAGDADRRVGAEGDERRRPPGLGRVVVVDEHHPGCRGRGEARVAGGRQATVGASHDGHAVVVDGRQRLGGAVGRAVVDHHQLEVRAVLVEDRPHRATDPVGPVVCTQHDRDLGDHGREARSSARFHGRELESRVGFRPPRHVATVVAPSGWRQPPAVQSTAGPAQEARWCPLCSRVAPGGGSGQVRRTCAAGR